MKDNNGIITSLNDHQKRIFEDSFILRDEDQMATRLIITAVRPLKILI